MVVFPTEFVAGAQETEFAPFGCPNTCFLVQLRVSGLYEQTAIEPSEMAQANWSPKSHGHQHTALIEEEKSSQE